MKYFFRFFSGGKKDKVFINEFYRLNRFIRFLIVGVVNTGFSYSIYAALIFLQIHYSIAILIANGLGILFNFHTIGGLVFQSKEKNLIFKFFFVYVLVYILSVGSVKILLMYNISKYAAGALIAVPMAFIAFTLNRKIVFTKSKGPIHGHK